MNTSSFPPACLPLAVTMLLSLSTTPRLAHAADAVDAASEEAAAHFKKGTNAYRAGDLDEAVREIKAAVKLKPTPNGIFALGQALREQGDLPAAAHQYRQYLVLASTGPFAAQSRAFLATIDQTIDATKRAQTAPPRGVLVPAAETGASAGAPPPTEPTKTAIPKSWLHTMPVAVTQVDDDEVPTVPRRRPLYKRWWPWTIGVVLIGTSIGLGVGLTRGGGSAPPATHFGSTHVF